MALRVDRQTALGWLGIEGYRPSGRVDPVAPRSMPADEAGEMDLPIETAVDAERQLAETMGASPAAETAAVVEAEAGIDVEGRAGRDEGAQARSVATGSEAPSDGSATRLTVSVDSPHRPLAEAIARVAGLACETDPAGDCLHLAGETWSLAALADDAQAKRQLWRALVARGRWPRA
ncbi:hypothetical protein GM160_02410 [Guyparkeria halophila]|uniref:Uncharacterized protein n=1 Tax=Guyparkeria halophila TaxID=47960 RepID=A0A6I6D161_9GAMM|nr:hypothetical protein [Guyparkeria halophila]QGT77837.1 hypothetical protein GM160_02410 [Guyparkeria halophila]